jgi:hypothetical protein
MVVRVYAIDFFHGQVYLVIAFYILLKLPLDCLFRCSPAYSRRHTQIQGEAEGMILLIYNKIKQLILRDLIFCVMLIISIVMKVVECQPRLFNLSLVGLVRCWQSYTLSPDSNYK